MPSKEKIKQITFKIENNIFLTIIRNGLTMMIPLVLIGGIACALINLPFINYDSLSPFFKQLHIILDAIYQGTFGLFSLALVIALSLCYGMENNETTDKVGLYIIVALGSYSSQLHIASEHFNFEALGAKGSFSAIFITMFSCFCYDKIKRITIFSLKKYSLGMNVICTNAINTLIPMALVICLVVKLTQLLYFLTGVRNLNELFTNTSCNLFANIDNNFSSGLLYTFLLHLLWICGFHGSHVLEPVAQGMFSVVTENIIFSKSFFDTYVVMGGCGTTICVLLVLLFFFRKDRMSNYAKLASPTVIFNLNEVLNFGIPIVLNPILAIPFILTPIVIYTLAYWVTYIGLVPPIIHEVAWSTPFILSGYLGTGSIRGSLLQIVCIMIGMAIYYPFIQMHKQVQETIAKEKLNIIINDLQNDELMNEVPQFLTRADSQGQIFRMLLEDLKTSIKEDKLFLLYQPQMDDTGKCLGAEALLRWIHPLYGFIYPPLIIHLAKEGGILQQLEEYIFDIAGRAIKKTSEEYDGDFKISINITGKSLLWDIETCIDSCLRKYDIPAEYMWLEITEQDVISNADFVTEKLKRLNNLGHTLLIDDFGMGHTSLIYLQSNYFGVVKLDGSLVKNIIENETNQKIISSIVELGKELNIKVIAEYVETTEQRDLLQALGCHWYQGYLYSKPIPLDDFIQCMKEHNQF
ncbi:MAG: PTS sugar transporter subunit IIC/EAL domain-containing protein [Lachnospiraceae bacterium]|nr:PTS sugar transporter subunit IIC/EAL domain-containing protein [Lachnospiraceae bacterium]